MKSPMQENTMFTCVREFSSEKATDTASLCGWCAVSYGSGRRGTRPAGADSRVSPTGLARVRAQAQVHNDKLRRLEGTIAPAHNHQHTGPQETFDRLLVARIKRLMTSVAVPLKPQSTENIDMVRMART